MRLFLPLFLILLLLPSICAAQTLTPGMHHLRSGQAREWATFPPQAEGKQLLLSFDGRTNPTEQTLRLRHRDLRQQWIISLNDKQIAKLPLDENEMVTYWPIPPRLLKDGQNQLKIACAAPADAESDDISIGQIDLFPRPRSAILSASSLDITVTENDSPIPSRITIADRSGALIDLGITSDFDRAVRPGVIYTATGKAHVTLPAGKYTIYAGRGFEYSVASHDVTLAEGDYIPLALDIRRVVPTPGLISSDTHIHTLYYSRTHGDATLNERMLTLAGEDIELPIATEHNLQVDYSKPAKQAGVQKYFTPVIGNELTTEKLGHFNVFPIPAHQPLLNWRRKDWKGIAEEIAKIPGDPVVILNHARDIHGGFRPFDPAHHISITGQTLDMPAPPANAMEVINSGAIQTDPMLLFHDWMGMLNRGHLLTPIAGSDSHDVTRYIVGQGRTYIQCDDSDPGHISIDAARKAILAGHVCVSYGLLARITVQDRFGPGDLVQAKGEIKVEAQVLGPEWVKARHVTLYANGLPIKEADIADGEKPGVKLKTTWTLPHPPHDIHLVAIATGDPITPPFWPTAQPYQPTSIDFHGCTISATGAIYIDADGSGHFDSAFDYARRIVDASGGDLPKIFSSLDGYDAAVAAQAASILVERFAQNFSPLVEKASPPIRLGFQTYLAQWRASQSARAKPQP